MADETETVQRTYQSASLPGIDGALAVLAEVAQPIYTLDGSPSDRTFGR